MESEAVEQPDNGLPISDYLLPFHRPARRGNVVSVVLAPTGTKSLPSAIRKYVKGDEDAPHYIVARSNIVRLYNEDRVDGDETPSIVVGVLGVDREVADQWRPFTPATMTAEQKSLLVDLVSEVLERHDLSSPHDLLGSETYCRMVDLDYPTSDEIFEEALAEQPDPPPENDTSEAEFGSSVTDIGSRPTQDEPDAGDEG